MKGKVAPTKSTTNAYVSFCFSLSTVVSPALYHETNETIPLHFRNVFHIFSEKNSLSKTFLVECVRSCAASCKNRREFWRETHTPLWLLIRRIIFLTREKYRARFWLDVSFSSRVKTIVRSSARTNLRRKIYDLPFWSVFFSMYIINIVNRARLVVLSSTTPSLLQFLPFFTSQH